MLILKLFQVAKKPGSIIVAEAKLKELENWKINKVYDGADNEKQSSTSVIWVVNQKMPSRQTTS